MEQIRFDPQGIAEQRNLIAKAVDLPPCIYRAALRLTVASEAYPAALTEIERMLGLLAERDENIERLDALVDGLRCCEAYYNDYREENAALRAQVDSLTRERDAAVRCIRDTETYIELGSRKYALKTIADWRGPCALHGDEKGV